MSERRMPAKTYEHMDKAIRQPVHESGICPYCKGSGSATFFSDFPCATCSGSGFVDADGEGDGDE